MPKGLCFQTWAGANVWVHGHAHTGARVSPATGQDLLVQWAMKDQRRQKEEDLFGNKGAPPKGNLVLCYSRWVT